MKEFMLLAAAGFILLSCFKAYQSVKLLEKDQGAWERLQQTEDEKRRRRQEAIGKALVYAVNFVSSLVNKKERGE